MVDSDQPTVLVVDDVAGMRLLMEDMVKDIGFPNVELANDGEEAFAKVLAKPPILIFSDYMMPKMNGIELLKKIRETPAIAAIPFILVTAVAEKETVAQALALGLTKHLTKPVDFGQLRECALECLKFSGEQQL
jgi:two-component system chemotaxis response regulator CheY